MVWRPMSEPDSKIVRTMCPMNCHPTLCGMLAEVRDGELISVRGDEANPDSRGFLCIRGQASREVIGNPARLLHPLVRDRRGDEFRRASWDEALDRIVAGIERSPPEATAIWPGHGQFTTSYGTRISAQLLARFANFHGSQFFSPTMICWGLGAFGLGLTGMLETNTKEDMGEHAQLILLWAANLTSQPNTAPHLLAPQRRGAQLVTIDVRRTEAAAKSDDVLIIRPGTDAALALALMHVICAERRHDAAFVAKHTLGFEQLADHVRAFSPTWAAEITGIEPDRIMALARRYADTRPAMIVLGGSSMHKGANGWQAGRAIACLPALTGNLGIAGGGFGPRHGARSHGQELTDITALDRRPPGRYLPNQMSRVTEALSAGDIRVLLLFGTDMLSSFAEAGRVADGLARTELVVSYDLFMHETARRFADVILPSTAWLEELGCKSTNTHLYLMEKALEPPGEARTLPFILRGLAARLGLPSEFYPWEHAEGPLDAILDHPSTGHATVASLRAAGGIRALRISHIAYPERRFDTPSGKVEFHSERAVAAGLPALPIYESLPPSAFSLAFRQGRTLSHFHGFYDHGAALPTLARLDPEPRLWMSPVDAMARGLADGARIRIRNERGEFLARALVTERVSSGTVWMRDGWEGLNRLTSGDACLPDDVVDLFGFSAGQAAFDAM